MSLYGSAPSNPNPFGGTRDYYYHHASAPTSPTRAAAVYANDHCWINDMNDDNNAGLVDFAFSFAEQYEEGTLPQALTPADELFEAGRIRPLKPIQLPPQDVIETSRSPISSGHTGNWSPRNPRGNGASRGGKGFNPLLAAPPRIERGRERALSTSTSRSSPRTTRSLSPLRGQEISEEIPSPSAITASTSKDGGSKKWRLRDLLLFRSASEGRATERGSKDPLHKYTFLSPTARRVTTEARGAGRGQVAASATEIHYTENRAASEETRKKTALPYHRVGLFGYLGFNPAINSITRSRGRLSS